MDNRLLLIGEVAERLRISVRTVQALIAGKKLRAANVGLGPKRPRWVIGERDLERFIDGRANVNAPEQRPPRPRRDATPNYFAHLNGK